MWYNLHSISSSPRLDSPFADGFTYAVAYRVGFLVDGLNASKPVHDLIAWAATHSRIEAVALVVHAAPQISQGRWAKFLQLIRQTGLYTAVSRAVFAAVSAAERKLLLRSGPEAEHRRPHPIGHLVRQHLQIEPIISKSGFVYRFGPKDLEAVQALEFDVLIRCGNGILKGGILNAARNGVVSMHHGDNRVNRGGPAGFWEVLNGEPLTGFIVQRLTDELDGGEVLYRGNISTALFYAWNHVALLERSNQYLMRTIERLCEGECVPEPPHVYDGRLFRTPPLHVTLLYLAKTAFRLGKRSFRRIVGRHWHWGIAYQQADWRRAVLHRGRPIPNPPGRFLADPFALEVDGVHYVLVEEYSYRARKGVISAYRIDDVAAQPLGVVLEEDWHLSFPFVFRDGETLYMVPESSADRTIRLYRCTRVPDRWELAQVIMRDVAAADTIIFKKQHRWWMLTTIQGAGMAANDAELHAFFSDSVLGNWTPHALNPVVMDAKKGRNGGLLRHGNDIYRVAQGHVFNRYGATFSIQQITRLSPTEYDERCVQRIQPQFFKGIAGTHHFHEASGLVVYDFVRNKRPQ